MHCTIFSSVLIVLFAISHGVHAAWPYGPFSSSGRWIVNSEGGLITYAGVNWPGAAEVMIPEGLQYRSIAAIVSDVSVLRMNVIRLTYAIEMIDDILDNGGDVTVQNSLIKALGTTDGNAVFNRILANNPQFTAATTRLQVFSAVAAECFRNQIYVHLDNHVSKAQWCCANGDGNGWFGDQYFDVAKWQRGLTYMARQGAIWGNMMSMGLRNELRNSGSSTYGWPTWYTNMVAAANAIFAVNPDPLIFFSGLASDTTLAPIPVADPLGDGIVFHKATFVFQNKIVLELHKYQSQDTSCSGLVSGLTYSGYDALGVVANQLPVVMTEWGFPQDGVTYKGVYASCLRTYLPQEKAGWMVWVLAGSYYIRSGELDADETWGLLDHTWSNWRSAVDINDAIEPMVSDMLT